MDDVKDLFPLRRPAAADPTLSADGLDGLFEEPTDATLAVDTVAELFDAPTAQKAAEPQPPLVAASDTTLEVDDDLLDAVESLDASDDADATDAVSPADSSNSAESNAPIGELVASLAEELQKIEAALRDSDDDSAA